MVRTKALPRGQAFLADTSPGCVSFLFSACCLECCCSAHFTAGKCPSPSHSSHSGLVPWQKHYLCHAVMGWLSVKPLTSTWKSVQGWQGNHSPLGSDEGGDRPLPRSSIGGMEQGRVSALPQVVLLPHFTFLFQAGILGKLYRCLP